MKKYITHLQVGFNAQIQNLQKQKLLRLVESFQRSENDLFGCETILKMIIVIP